MKKHSMLAVWLAVFWSCGAAVAQEPQKLNLYLETRHAMMSGAFSQNDKGMVSWDDNALKLWDAELGRELDTIKDIDQAVFSPDEKTAVLLSLKNGTITLWDVNDWRELRTLSWTATLLPVSFFRIPKQS